MYYNKGKKINLKIFLKKITQIKKLCYNIYVVISISLTKKLLGEFMKTNEKIMEEGKIIIENDAKEYFGLSSARNTYPFKRLIKQKENGLELSKIDLTELFEELGQLYYSNGNIDHNDLEQLSEKEIQELEEFELKEMQKQKNEILEFLTKL